MFIWPNLTRGIKETTINENTHPTLNWRGSWNLKVLKASWRRWPIVILFSISCMHWAFQWCSYISCSTVISKYYGVSQNMITWEMSSSWFWSFLTNDLVSWNILIKINGTIELKKDSKLLLSELCYSHFSHFIFIGTNRTQAGF